MHTCLHCNAQISEGIFYCGNCGAAINSPATCVTASQPEVPPQGSPASSSTLADGDLHERLEKAMRRTELLSYAAAGLGIAILFAIIGVAFV